MLCDFCGNFCPIMETIQSKTVAGIVHCSKDSACTKEMKNFKFYRLTSLEGFKDIYAYSPTKLMYFDFDTEEWCDSVIMPCDFLSLPSKGIVESLELLC